MSRQLFICALICLTFAVPVQAASFTYSGTIDTATDAFAVLLPPGSTVQGTFEFNVPGPNQTTDDPATVLSVEIFAIPAGFSNGFCFAYVTGCEGPGKTTVPIVSVTGFSIGFDETGFPSTGFIGFDAFAPSDPAVWLSFDLSNDLFVLEGSPGFGMASGAGNFQQQVVPLPSAIWLLTCGLLALSGLGKWGQTTV